MSEPLSKSRIECFELCPRRYKYIYVEGRKAELEESVEARLGKSFHQFAYDFFDLVDEVKLETLKTLEDVETYFRSLVPEHLPTAVRRWCYNFCSFEARHYISVRKIDSKYFFPIARELMLEVEDFKGIIDRIDLLTSNKAIVIEYKTSPYWNLRSLRRELTFYAALINSAKVLDIPVVRIGCYSAYFNRWWYGAITKQTVRAILRRIQKMKEQIAEGKFPRRLTAICRRCEFSQECLYGG